MISLSLFYTVLSFIAALATIVSISIFEFFRLRIVRKSSVDEFNKIFGAMMFNNPRRFTIAFASLSVGALLLAVGFVLNFILSFYIQTPIVWEAFSGVTLILVAVFFLFFTGVYNLKLWKLYL
jgi:hypothetical protein